MPLSCSDTGAQPVIPYGKAYLLSLATPKVYHAFVVTNKAVRSYRTFSPLPILLGGLFSVALAVS